LEQFRVIGNVWKGCIMMTVEEPLVTYIEGYEPFDLLRLSKDAFYDVVKEKFPTFEIIEMTLSFLIIGEEVVIRAELIEYREAL